MKDDGGPLLVSVFTTILGVNFTQRLALICSYLGGIFHFHFTSKGRIKSSSQAYRTDLWTPGAGVGEKERLGHMETVTWKLTLPYIK